MPFDVETEPNVVFEGATKLPFCSETSHELAIKYWCKLLSELRQVLFNAEWRVHIEDIHIPWDDKRQAFDCS